jgi:hypothetical protein
VVLESLGGYLMEILIINLFIKPFYKLWGIQKKPGNNKLKVFMNINLWGIVAEKLASQISYVYFIEFIRYPPRINEKSPTEIGLFHQAWEYTPWVQCIRTPKRFFHDWGLFVNPKNATWGWFCCWLYHGL